MVTDTAIRMTAGALGSILALLVALRAPTLRSDSCSALAQARVTARMASDWAPEGRASASRPTAREPCLPSRSADASLTSAAAQVRSRHLIEVSFVPLRGSDPESFLGRGLLGAEKCLSVLAALSPPASVFVDDGGRSLESV